MKLKTRPSPLNSLQSPASTRPALMAGQWVHLTQRPHPYSGDQALLLCQEEQRWVAWVPGYGELRLRPERLVME